MEASCGYRFHLNPENLYFNASYGVVPKSVSAFHRDLLVECEANPYKWFTQTYKHKVIEAKRRLAPYLRASAADVVLVDNSSSAANSVFNSLTFDAKSVIIVLDTAYGLIDKLLEKMTTTYDCKIVSVRVNIDDVDQIKSSLADKIEELQQTGLVVRLACLDHVSSCPALKLPVCDIARVCKRYGVPTLVDGAHALGQVEIDMRAFEEAGVCYWFTDTHKWFFSPKGSAVLWVTKSKQSGVLPTIDCAAICSKGCTVLQNCCSPSADSLTEFESRFVYLGTKDYTPWISVSAAIDFVEQMGGYRSLIDRNRALSLWAQRHMATALETRTIPEELTASMCNVLLPFVRTQADSRKLMAHLMENNTYVVICEHPAGCFWLRLCIQLFVDESMIRSITDKLLEYQKVYLNP